MRGKVVYYNPDNQYGFIEIPEICNYDIYFHNEDVGEQLINKGDQVEFVVISTLRGLIAKNIVVSNE
jgi:cold shock CspA family protein